MKEASPAAGEACVSTSGTARSLRLVVANERGLHARAAARFAALADRFAAEVEVEKDGARVSGRSVMGLMMLAAAPGTTIEVHARGPDAVAALDALAVLVRNRFDE